MNSLVALTKSDGHYEGVNNALNLIEDQIRLDIKDKRRVLVKPNFVSTTRRLSATHVDAVKAILDIVQKYYSGKIVIGEGPASSNLKNGLINYEYMKLQDEYDVDFLDLNKDSGYEVVGFDRRLNPLKYCLSKTVIESDYRISVTLPKTHDTVITTLSIKNIVVGSLINYEKSKVHQGYKGINLNIAKFAQVVMPHLGVIDGFVGMEGRGPVSGDPVDFRVAAASIYPVSLDSVISKAMGFNPNDIGYLNHLSEWKKGVIDLNKIKIIGTSINEITKNFKPHPRFEDMLNWKE